MPFQFTQAELDKITAAYNEAESTLSSNPTATGAYAKVYDLIRVIISANAAGDPIYTDSQIAVLDLNTFTLNGVDTSGWQPGKDVNNNIAYDNSWVFLSGVADVNRGVGSYSDFIREYNQPIEITEEPQILKLAA